MSKAYHVNASYSNSVYTSNHIVQDDQILSIKLADLETVYKYFPEERPKVEEGWVPKMGDYITVEGLSDMKGKLIIAKYEQEYGSTKDPIRGKGPHITDFNRAVGKYYYDTDGWCFGKFGESTDRSVRKATLDEIQWLDKCISKGEFVPKEETLNIKPALVKTFDSVLPEKWCIKPDNKEQAKLMYPVGTVFHSTGGYRNCTILPETKFHAEGDYIGVSNILYNNHKADAGVRNLERWAEIVSKPIFDQWALEARGEQLKSPQEFKFKVGDKVIGNSKIKQKYTITTEGVVYIVVKADKGTFLAEVVNPANPSMKGPWTLAYDYFDLYTLVTSFPEGQPIIYGTAGEIHKRTEYPYTLEEAYLAGYDPYQKEAGISIRIDAEVSTLHIPKSASVTLKNSENEVKINVKQVKAVQLS